MFNWIQFRQGLWAKIENKISPDQICRKPRKVILLECPGNKSKLVLKYCWDPDPEIPEEYFLGHPVDSPVSDISRPKNGNQKWQDGDNIYHIRHCQHQHVFFSAWKLSGPHFFFIFFHLERISIHYWAETLIRTLQHSHTLPYTAGSTLTTVFSVFFI